MSKVFTKPFTQQEPVPSAAISRITEILATGRLHRYNTIKGEISDASMLEKEFAEWQGTQYCLATTSGGQAMQISLRAAGVKPGTKVLANAYTLAPVPGAIHATGGIPVFVDIDDNWHTDINDLEEKAKDSGAQYFMLSHMRGHIANMERIVAVCKKYSITLIEDCAHTMGAKWKGKRSGNFGDIACFSTQTYKHLNSGEGGFITTDNPEFAARAIVNSGSYMLYGSHGAIPSENIFKKVRLESPNCSARLDNIRAAILRAQLPLLEENILRWQSLYEALEEGFRAIPGLKVVKREPCEQFVGSSIQFQASGIREDNIPLLVKRCENRGVQLKWFGNPEPTAFTSKYDTWQYLGEIADLPNTDRVLSKTCDMRVPLTFSKEDCFDIIEIIADEVHKLTNKYS
ncbi:aminotransferase [Kiloniella spongiae]|uniref:Aminotransferase n=1 Tax=Kiloniella spongiae TaxID=1489064 RepID=A0A0H2MBN3_9PROT|nr:aminotransferase class I/II-fold pyridoxal phosphate-dependent enzyme [Kiloniella spongiae]KLN59611.1 aminotransferase [Kiloniella spongiae]